MAELALYLGFGLTYAVGYHHGADSTMDVWVLVDVIVTTVAWPIVPTLWLVRAVRRLCG